MAMTPLSKMVMVFPDTTVAAAARKVIDNQIDSLPVVRCVDKKTNDYEIVGRITKTNFTRLFVDIAEGREVSHHDWKQPDYLRIVRFNWRNGGVCH